MRHLIAAMLATMTIASAHADGPTFPALASAAEYAQLCEQLAATHGTARADQCLAYIAGIKAGWAANARSQGCREQIAQLSPLQVHGLLLVQKDQPAWIDDALRRVMIVATPACAASSPAL